MLPRYVRPLVLLASFTLGVACTDDPAAPPAGGTGGGGGSSAGSGGRPGTGGAASGTGGSAAAGSGGSATGGSQGGTDARDGAPADADAAPTPDAPAGDTSGDVGGDTATDGGLSAPVGTRVSLEDVVSGRWVGTRRTVTMDGASKVFTAGFEAGKFGAGGNGHLIRLNIPGGKEYIFEYRIRFDTGYDFSRGGKIPGLAGGNAPSGCQTSTDIGFTARQMWREQGRLIGYIYDMDQRSACGNAEETGFNFQVGKWYRVKQRVKLNTGSLRNGILQLWIDDRQVINRSNMGWMIEAPNRRIDRIFLDFFFGGSTADWSPSRNCSLSFGDVFITKLEE